MLGILFCHDALFTVVSGKKYEELRLIVSESWDITQYSNTMAGRLETDCACIICHWARGVIGPRGSIYGTF